MHKSDWIQPEWETEARALTWSSIRSGIDMTIKWEASKFPRWIQWVRHIHKPWHLRLPPSTDAHEVGCGPGTAWVIVATWLCPQCGLQDLKISVSTAGSWNVAWQDLREEELGGRQQGKMDGLFSEHRRHFGGGCLYWRPLQWFWVWKAKQIEQQNQEKGLRWANRIQLCKEPTLMLCSFSYPSMKKSNNFIETRSMASSCQDFFGQFIMSLSSLGAQRAWGREGRGEDDGNDTGRLAGGFHQFNDMHTHTKIFPNSQESVCNSDVVLGWARYSSKLWITLGEMSLGSWETHSGSFEIPQIIPVMNGLHQIHCDFTRSELSCAELPSWERLMVLTTAFGSFW